VHTFVGSLSDQAKKKDGNKRNTLLDKQMKLNRQECEQELERKGHDDPCNAEPIHRENCLLRCASPACYEQLYAHDPLEEGEVDTVRGRSFRSCQRTEIKEKQKEESKLAKEGAKNL